MILFGGNGLTWKNKKRKRPKKSEGAGSLQLPKKTMKPTGPVSTKSKHNTPIENHDVFLCPESLLAALTALWGV